MSASPVDLASVIEQWLGRGAAPPPEVAEPQDLVEAERRLEALAGALFPTGGGELRQLTWQGDTATAPRVNGGPQTERDRAEAKLRAAELRYRTLVEQIPAVTFMAVLGEGENEIYVSPHIEALLGFTQKEWLENPFLWYSQLHPDDRSIWHEEFSRGIHTGGPFHAECRFLARDGRVVWVRGEARLIKDEAGRPLFLQGVAFDITESKRAQAAAVAEAIRGTEQRYRDLVEHLDAIFWEVDLDSSRFTFVSHGAQRILGFPIEQWLADPLFWLSRAHPDDRALVKASWEAARDSGVDQEFEFRAIANDARHVWLQVRIRRPLTVGKGRYLLGVMLDVTERKEMEVERARLHGDAERARDAAEAANRSKDEFLATVSHELRTPLNALIGYAQLLRSQQIPPHMVGRALERIELSAQAQSRLVEDLLDVSRIITGKMRLDVAPVELAQVISGAIDAVRLSAEAKHIKIEHLADGAGLVVSGDAARLQQVVWNFLSNAVKYTPPGGRIEIAVERLDRAVRVRVTDSGEGIHPDFLPSVFERFRQADSTITRKHGGLGLGLAIARHLVEAHGGRVWAESKGLGHGASFVAELPLSEIHEEGIRAGDQSPERGEVSNDPLRGLRLLVVDDEQEAQELLRAVFEGAGADVTVAGSAAEAMQQLPIVRPDVFVGDLGMPTEDGFHLLSRIRTTPAGERLPALAITGYTDAAHRERARAVGYDAFAAKPINVPEIVRTVARLARRSPGSEGAPPANPHQSTRG